MDRTLHSKIEEFYRLLYNKIKKDSGEVFYKNIECSDLIAKFFLNKIINKSSFIKKIEREDTKALVDEYFSRFKEKTLLRFWLLYIVVILGDIMKYLFLQVISRFYKQPRSRVNLFISNPKFIKFLQPIEAHLEKNGVTPVHLIWNWKHFKSSSHKNKAFSWGSFPSFWEPSYRKFHYYTSLIDKSLGFERQLKNSHLVFVEGCLPAMHFAARTHTSLNGTSSCLQWGFYAKAVVKSGWRDMPYDRFYVWGDFFKDQFQKDNPNLQIRSIGHPNLSTTKTANTKNGVLFAAQKKLGDYISREQVSSFLAFGITYAKNNPGKKIILRSHPDHDIPEDILTKALSVPNITVHDYKNFSLQESFKDAKYCVSISSTVCLESVANNCYPVYLEINNLPVILHEIFRKVNGFCHVTTKAGFDGLLRSLESRNVAEHVENLQLKMFNNLDEDIPALIGDSILDQSLASGFREKWSVLRNSMKNPKPYPTINLIKSKWSVHKWGNNVIYFKGFLYYDKKAIFSALALFENVLQKKEPEESSLKKLLTEKNISGEFACVISTGNTTFLFTDVIRSQALHIQSDDNGMEITDYIDEENTPGGLNSNAIETFVSSRFVLDSTNCYQNIYSLQAAELVVINNNKITNHRYFKFIPHPKPKEYYIPEFSRNFDEQMKNIVSRMLRSAPTVHNWIIPLSGGHDSRMLINYLFKAGIKNVICFSYGTPNNIQSRISKKVAVALGYEWHFVEYTEEKWDILHRRGLIDEYIDYSFQGISTPHLQDFLAVYELKEKAIIKPGDIFVPGHTLDFVAGRHSHEADMACNTKKDGLLRTIKRHSIHKDLDYPGSILLKDIFNSKEIHPSQFQEYINWQERQVKFIGNSCRVYEFFGFEFRMPFWDREFLEFWLQVSPKNRLRRNLILRSEKGILAKELSEIPFEDEVIVKKKSLKQKVKAVVPEGVILLLLRVTGSKQRLPEGLNQIFAKKAKNVREVIGPIERFPRPVHYLIKPMMSRYPYQMNYHFLSSLYTLRRTFDKQNLKNEDNTHCRRPA